MERLPKKYALYVSYAIKHKIICNAETIKIIKKYSKQIFNVHSDFDIAFYKDKECYMFTTAHENYMGIKKDL